MTRAIVVRQSNIETFILTVDRLCGGLHKQIQMWWPDLDNEDAPTAATPDKVEAPTAPTAPIKQSRDSNNAERQRRYRERKLNGSGTVMHCNGHAVTASD